MKKQIKKAFTLVELIIVITILAILATIAFLSLNNYPAEARDAKLKTQVGEIFKKIKITKAKEPVKVMLNDWNFYSNETFSSVGATEVNAKYWEVDFSVIWVDASRYPDANGSKYKVFSAEYKKDWKKYFCDAVKIKWELEESIMKTDCPLAIVNHAWNTSSY